MSRQSRDSRPPPPPNFPTPNVPRGSAYSQPPGAVYSVQSESALYRLGVCAICDVESRGFLASDHGTYPPQQSVAYATPQPHQLEPPPAQRTRDPHSATTHAPASAYSYSSSPPRPSAHLPSSGPPQAPSSMPVPSVPGGYDTFSNFSRAPPPPMMQRVATMPTPGQAHNPHSVPYHNVQAPVIAHQPSHSGMSEGTRYVTGDWSHRACIVYNVYQNMMLNDRLFT